MPRRALLLTALLIVAAPCWGRSGTPTPTPTARPPATGDLGTRLVHGQVRDASHTEPTGIAGASVWYNHFARLGGGGPGVVATDANGGYTFSLFLHDTDDVTIGVEAAGFQPRVLHFGGYEFYSQPPVDIAMVPLDAGASGHRVGGTLRGPFCDQPWAGAEIDLRPTGRRVITDADGRFTFENVADGTYQLTGPDCFGVPCVPPADVTVAGDDVNADLCQELCPSGLLIDPPSVRAGEGVTVSGFCYYLHSGGHADLLLDDRVVGEVRGNTAGDYSTCISVPADVEPGRHALRVVAGTDERAAGEIVVVADCRGDCDGDGAVSIDELVRGVSIALGTLPVSACAAIDVDADGAVGIDELIGALDRALNGCESS